MREIKFRAWDEQKKVMHHDFQFIRSGIEGNDWIVFTSDKNLLGKKPHPLENPYFQQQLKIMQFTGIQDKNGKEIYEGDILKGKHGDAFPVKWSDSTAEFIAAKDGYAYIQNEVWYNREVIGNIYENPDLMK